MADRKLSQKQWEFEIKRALRVRETQHRKMRQAKFQYVERFMKPLLFLPVLIGIAAAVLIVILYGWREFLKFLLSWVVSLTLVATGAYYLWKFYEKDL